jgi:DNA repair exonuclease SbcCD ATPase subunit
MEELERIVGARLGKIKAAVKQGEAEVVDEAEQAGQLVESLKVRIAVLEAKLKETQEALRNKDFARQQAEETLRAGYQELQNDLSKKDHSLGASAQEINQLKLDLDAKVKRIGELESAAERAQQAAADQAARSADLAERSRATAAALESQLREAQEISGQKHSIIEALEQKLSAKAQEYDGALKDKQKLLAWQQAEIADLNTQLQVLKKGIGEMSSFFRQAENLPGINGQDAGSAAPREPVNGKQERGGKAERSVAKAGPLDPSRAADVLTQEVFQRITGELAEVTGVISPLASVIVRQQVEALGESVESFPKTRLSELLESLAREIADEKQQIDFRGRLGRSAQISLN